MLLYKFIERIGFKLGQFWWGNSEWVKTLWQGLYVANGYRLYPPDYLNHYQGKPPCCARQW